MTTASLRNYYIWTIGCQMNKSDSERLASALEQMGLQPVTAPREADVIVLNSCVVRQNAEDKVVGTLTSMAPLKTKQPERVLALMGCMVGSQTAELRQRFPYVDVFMRPQQCMRWPVTAYQIGNGDQRTPIVLRTVIQNIGHVRISAPQLLGIVSCPTGAAGAQRLGPALAVGP